MDKIIFGITGLTLGGAERVLVDIANKLTEKFDVTIFTIYSGGELENELNSEVHIQSLYNKKYTDFNKIKRILIPLKILIKRRWIYKKYINNVNYLAEIAFLEGPITRIFSCKNKGKCKKIAWIHNDISKTFGKNLKSKIQRIFDRNIYEKYTTIIFVSIDNLDKFNKTYDDIMLPKEKVIHNYINSERILELSKENIEHENILKKDEVNIIQVSRLVEQKAIHRLIDVHSKLIEEGVKHHIYIIGEGPLKESLKKYIKDKNVEKTFTLLGSKKNPYPYMKKADAICLFSKFEGYGMVVDEAKILGKYVAITNTAAREALIDYPDNSIVVNNNEDGIQQAIRYIVNNKSKILQKNTKYVYTNDKIIDKIIKVVKE